MDAPVLEVQHSEEPRTRRAIERILRIDGDSIKLVERHDERLWEDAEELTWTPAPRMRVMNRWLDQPSGFLASLRYLIDSSEPSRQELLSAVEEERDLLGPGLRVYRDPARRGLRLPPSPRRYRYHAPNKGPTDTGLTVTNDQS